MSELPRIFLSPNRERSLLKGHPWIFSGAVAKTEGDPGPGDVVRVLSKDGEFLAYGFFSPESMIRVRILERDEGKRVDESWWREKIARALSRRSSTSLGQTTDAYRLVYSEADGLPGLIVDRYADYMVVQSLSAGMERVKDIVVDELAARLGPIGIYERSDSESRALEGLEERKGVLHGAEPPGKVEIVEEGCRFLVDVKSGQKTGFYLDQRNGRAEAFRRAEGKEVLDCFAYTGAFTVRALRGGAKAVTTLESSKDALDLAAENVELNFPGDGRVEYLAGNAFELLRRMRDKGRRFDMIVLDPPKLARSRNQLEKAARAYKDANLLAMKLLAPGGVLLTFSCSGAVGLELFTEIVHWAAIDSGREVRVVGRSGQPEDHPLRLGFPESEYLKGLVCRVE